MKIEKKINLLKIKRAIEKECDKPTKTLATINELCECFNELLDDKQPTTITTDVALWFKQYDFISVREKGVGFVISYVACAYMVKGLNCYGYHLDKIFECEEEARKYLEQKKKQEGVLSLSFYINSVCVEAYESRGLKLVKVA